MASLAPTPRAIISGDSRRAALQSCAPHDHLCLIYDTREEQLSASVPFLRIGLERGEKCIYIADENTPAAILEAMRADGIDVDAALGSGALTILARNEAYLKNGAFDPAWMIGFLRSQIEAAEAQGFTSFRVTGETTWALRPPQSLDPLIEYECRLNDFFPIHNLLALCQYNRKRFRPETLLQVLHTHPFVVHGALVCDNPHYIPPEFFGKEEHDPAARVQRLLGSIVQNARLKQKVALETQQTRRVAAESDRWRRLYEAMLANTPDLGYIFDLDHRFTYANHALLAMWGRTWDEAIGKNCLELGYEPWHAVMHDREIDQVIATGRSIRGEVAFTGANGRRIYDYIFYPVLGPGGEVEAVAGTTRDITDRNLSEEALRQSEERFRTMVDTTPECVKVVSADGTLLHMNPSGLAMIGAQAPAEVLGKSIYSLVAPEHRAAVRAFNQRVCHGEKGSLQFDILGLHGVRRHMESHSSPLRTPDGDTVQLALTRDITERKQAEQAMRENEKHYRELLDALPVAAYATDADGTITLFNEAAAEFAGRRAQLGKDKWCVTHRLYRADGSILPHDECPMAVSLRTGQPQRGVEAIAERPDGTRAWFLPYPTLLRDAAGNITGGMNVLVDITERKRVEESLRETEERLRADLEDTLRLQSISAAISGEQDSKILYDKVLDSAVALMRSDFGILQMLYPERGSAGELRLLASRGLTPEATANWEWVRPDTRSTCGASLTARKRVVVPDIAQCAWIDGSEEQSLLLQADIRAAQSTPLVSRTGKLLGIITTHWRSPHQPSERDFRHLDIVARQAADLIERKLAEDRQRQSEDALRKSEKFAAAGRMAATVAHEINNPLEAVTNLSYLLAQEELTPSARSFLQSLQVELDRVSHITRQTLAFYREGKSAVPFDLAQPIDAAVTLFSRKAERQGASIQVILKASATLYGFAGELRQVFANLISNSLEAGATTIKIRVSPSRVSTGSGGSWPRPGVRVLVSDNGSGISSEYARKLFQPFFTTKEEKGTGLGLWVSKGIVQKHEGSIRVRTSTQPGRRGTAFRLLLPTFERYPN
ncbi:MAG: MEDS domain-containing protein [Acidobacteriaceae bacterium]